MTREDLLWWADGVSAMLLLVMYIALPLPPRERLWPRTGECLWWTTIIAINVIWNIVRFVVEGLTKTEVPRGFMDLTLVYCAVWSYTVGAGWNQDAKTYQRTKQIMAELRNIKMVREGRSTSTHVRFGHDRNGETEVVVRKGCPADLWPWLAKKQITGYTHHPQIATPGRPNVTQERDVAVTRLTFLPRVIRRDVGVTYWRGTELEVDRQANDKGDRAWKVRLAERELHATYLEPFMRPGSVQRSENTMRDMYKAIYDVVYLSCRSSADHPFLGDPATNPRSMWPQRWKHLRPEYLAQQTNCTDDTSLGGVARRIAADSVYYVFSADPSPTCRTEDQVQALNDIVEYIANDLMETKVPS